MSNPPPPPMPPGPQGRPPEPPPPPAAGGRGSTFPSAGGADVRVRSERRVSLSQVASPYAIWVGVLVVLIFAAPNLLILAVSGTDVLEAATTEPSSFEMVVGLVITVFLQLIVFTLSLLPLLVAGRPFSRLLGPTKATWAMVGIGVAVGIGTVVITYVVSAIVAVLTGPVDGVEQELMDMALSGGAAMVLSIVIAVVLAPITEEVVFRGVLFRALADRVGHVVGAVLSAAIFALIHVEVLFSQPLGLVGLFVVGVLLAVSYHVTGSLIVPILGHAVFNGASIAFAIVIDRLELATLMPTGVG